MFMDMMTLGRIQKQQCAIPLKKMCLLVRIMLLKDLELRNYTSF